MTAIDLVILFFNEMFDLISGIIFPATGTPVSVLAAFGIIFPLVVIVLSFVRSLARGNS